MRKIFVAVSIAACFGAACTKTNEADSSTSDTTEKVRLLVGQLAAKATNTQLSSRTDWKLLLQTEYYLFTFATDTILGIPQTSPYEFLLDKGERAPLQSKDEPRIYFFSPEYIRGLEFVATKDHASPPVFSFKDQSTFKDLVDADILIGIYAGVPGKKLTGIQLTHANALIELDAQKISGPYEISISDLKHHFKPYNYEPGRFMAIVTGKWLGTYPTPTIHLKFSGQEYVADVMNYDSLKSNRHYKLSLEFDEVAKKLSIKNISTKKWSDEMWPQ